MQATFFILIARPVFKECKGIAVFFGGFIQCLECIGPGGKNGCSLGVFPDNSQRFYEAFECDRILYEVSKNLLIVLGDYGLGVRKEIDLEAQWNISSPRLSIPCWS